MVESTAAEHRLVRETREALERQGKAHDADAVRAALAKEADDHAEELKAQIPAKAPKKVFAKPCLCGCGTKTYGHFTRGHKEPLLASLVQATKDTPVTVTEAQAEWLSTKKWAQGLYRV